MGERLKEVDGERHDIAVWLEKEKWVKLKILAVTSDKFIGEYVAELIEKELLKEANSGR